MTTTEPRLSRMAVWAVAAAEEARAVRAQAARDCEVLRQENAQRLASSQERLRLTADMLRALAQERR